MAKTNGDSLFSSFSSILIKALLLSIKLLTKFKSLFLIAIFNDIGDDML